MEQPCNRFGRQLSDRQGDSCYLCQLVKYIFMDLEMIVECICVGCSEEMTTGKAMTRRANHREPDLFWINRSSMNVGYRHGMTVMMKDKPAVIVAHRDFFHLSRSGRVSGLSREASEQLSSIARA